MYLQYLRTNLLSITSQPHDTSLITSDSVHLPAHQHLLSAVSPYLASLLAQAGHATTIFLPFTSKVVTRVMQLLVAEQEEFDNTIDAEVVEAARDMGIMCLVEKDKDLPTILVTMFLKWIPIQPSK